MCSLVLAIPLILTAADHRTRGLLMLCNGACNRKYHVIIFLNDLTSSMPMKSCLVNIGFYSFRLLFRDVCYTETLQHIFQTNLACISLVAFSFTLFLWTIVLHMAYNYALDVLI